MSFLCKVKLKITLFFVFLSPGFAENLPVEKVDVVVLGGGVAGLTSALYLARAGLSPVVLEGSEVGGAITQSNNVQNWPGYEEISGFDLADRMKAQAEKSGALLYNEKVIAVDFSKKPFEMIAQDIYDVSKKRKLLAKSCIITLGSLAKRLGVPGEETYWSKGVYTCAVCDGSLYKDKTVAIVGGGDAAVLEADYLASLAKKVYILNRKPTFKTVEKQRVNQLLKKSNVEVIYDVSVQALTGDEHMLQQVELVDSKGSKSFLKTDALFLAIGASPNTKLFEKQLQLDASGYIVLTKGCETSVPGVFAAGDIVVANPMFKQAIIASGRAAEAALEVPDYLAKLQQESSLSSLSSSKKSKLEMTGQVIEITNAAQLKEILASSQVPVLIDFYATWCGPCRQLGRFVEGWARDLQGKVIVCKVNVDQARDVALKYKVHSMPTFITVSQEGKEVDRKVGTEEIIRYINKLKS